MEEGNRYYSPSVYEKKNLSWFSFHMKGKFGLYFGFGNKLFFTLITFPHPHRRHCASKPGGESVKEMMPHTPGPGKGIPSLDFSKGRPALPFRPRWQGRNLFDFPHGHVCLHTIPVITALSQRHPPGSSHLGPPQLGLLSWASPFQLHERNASSPQTPWLLNSTELSPGASRKAGGASTPGQRTLRGSQVAPGPRRPAAHARRRTHLSAGTRDAGCGA